MKYFKLFCAILLLNSCSIKFTTINEYSSLPLKFAKTKITHPTKDFSMTLPRNWFWKAEDYESEQIILGIDAGVTDSINGFTKIISVQKYKSSENNTELKAEYESLLKNIKKNKLIPQIVESGRTELMNYDSYFLHAKSENEKSIEMISFVVKSKEKGFFYSLTASCQIEDRLKTNMSMMVKCLESFEYN